MSETEWRKMGVTIVGTDWHNYVPGVVGGIGRCVGVLGNRKGKRCMQPEDARIHDPALSPFIKHRASCHGTIGELLCTAKDHAKGSEEERRQECVANGPHQRGLHIDGCPDEVKTGIDYAFPDLTAYVAPDGFECVPPAVDVNPYPFETPRSLTRKLVEEPIGPKRVQLVVTFLNGTTMYFPVGLKGWRVSEDRHIVLKGQDGAVVLKRIPLDNVAYYTVEEM